MGYTVEHTLQVVRQQGLLRYSGIIRGGGHRWGIDAQTRLALYIHRLESGLYACVDQHFGAVAQAAVKCPRGIICLLSALWVHGLLEREPPEVFMAIGAGARKPQWTRPAVRFVRMRPKLMSAGFDTRYVDAIPVPVFGLARTIVDCFRFRQLVGEDVAPRFLRLALARRRTSHQALFASADEGRAKRWVWDQVSRNVYGPELARLRALRDATWRR